MALLFDGINDFVHHGDIAAIDGTASLTVDLWANLSVIASANHGLVVKFNGGGAFETTFALYNNTDGTIAFLTDYGSGQRGETAINTLVVNTWTHLAAVYNGAGAANADRVKIYKNGVEVTPLNFSGTIPATLGSTTQNVQMGKMDQAPSWTTGWLSNIRIWTSVFSAAQIAQCAYSYHPIETTNLVLWAPYDDGVSAKDYSGSGNNGTVSGSIQTQGPPVAYGE